MILSLRQYDWPLNKHERNWSRNVSGSCFWDHHWGRAAIGQCFYLSPVTVPEVFANFTWPRFPLISKVANNIMFACALDHKVLRAGIKNKRFYTSSFSSLMKLLKLRYFGNVILLTQRKAQKMLLQGQKSILSV